MSPPVECKGYIAFCCDGMSISVKISMYICRIHNQRLTNIYVYIQIYIDIYVLVSFGDDNWVRFMLGG